MRLDSSAITVRRNRIVAAGLVDSLGLAIGWTAMSLQTVTVRGMGAFGLLSAAMLVGVALSAPFTGWLTSRVDGRRLLRITAGGEAVLRAASFIALFGGAPLAVVAGLVTISNVLAWTGFAGMRAEIAQLRNDGVWLSAYTAGIAAAEAMGAFVAAFLPSTGAGEILPAIAVVAGLIFSTSLLPTFLVAGRAQTPRAPAVGMLDPLRGRGQVLLGGTAITLLATGPTLLAVGLAAGLHGRAAVGPAMLVFAAGSLLGPKLAGWLSEVPLPTPVTWSFLGILMLGGWGVASASVAGLLAAQLLSGLALGAFEGVMDAAVARGGSAETMTCGLAWAGTARALGSAVAVSAAPALMALVGVGQATSLATIALVLAAFLGTGAAGIVGWWHRRRDVAPKGAAPWLGQRVIDTVVLLTADIAEADALGERYFGVHLHHSPDAASLWSASRDLDVPLVVVVGADVTDADVLAAEALVSRGGPWEGVRVRVIAPTSVAPPRLSLVA